METVFIGAASNTISSGVTVAIAPLIKFIDDAIHLDENTRLLQDKLSSLKALLQGITNQFQADQRSPPEIVNDGLQRLQRSLEEARGLIDRYQQQNQCLNCLFTCKPRPRLSRQVREWNTNLDQLLSSLQRDFSIFSNTQQIAASTPLPPETLLQPVPEAGFLGLGIQDAETMVQSWLNMEDHQFSVIGIYGVGGIGKTSLLRRVYNTCKQGNVFQAVIWTTVSQIINIQSMQSDVAEAINLNLESSSNAERRKMKLFTSLKEKKFLLVLDDLWSPIELEERVGIPVRNEKGSRVIISTRSRDVIRRMGGSNEYSIHIQPLSEEEGWELFCRKAFKDGVPPAKSIEEVARLIAGECKGLPLAINVLSAAVMGKETVHEWNLSLSDIKNVDPVFVGYSGIDEDLYQRLKWSYNRLPDSNFQNCFLYCAAFPEDAHILVEGLVEMWIGEGLVVQSRETQSLMDKGREYVKLLVERCLFEDAYAKSMEYIKVHDIVRDMAIYVAEKEENCFFRTSQNLQSIPRENGIVNSKRISIGYSDILPTELRCPNLLALLLSGKESLTQVPNDFFLNATSLRVLDMSHCTKIESLPESMWHLTQLEFLDLSRTSIKNLPEDICNLVRLQFLHLSDCNKLESLPSKIGELKTLKHLDLRGCPKLTESPREISQLTSLHKLNMWATGIELKTEEARSGVCSLNDLRNIPNLMELSVKVMPGIEVDGIRSGIKVGIMSTCLEMRCLRLEFHVDGRGDDVVMEDLPADMHNMKELQKFRLVSYCGRRLPNCICDFKQLERLELFMCYQLTELPLLERLPNLKSLWIWDCKKLRELGIGRWGSAAGFPMLELLILHHLPMLESMRSSSSNIVVWSEGMMPNLQRLTIQRCASLKRVPEEIVKLPKLKEIGASEEWWENLIWEDENVPKLLKDKLNKLPLYVRVYFL